MTALQAIFLGMMLVWTPGMVMFAYFLWKEIGGQHRQDATGRDAIVPESGVSHVEPGTSLVDF